MSGTEIGGRSHPLWMGMLLPIFSVFRGDTAVRVALTMSAAIDMLTTLVVFAIARRLTARRPLQLVTVAAYALNPGAVALAVNGMETSVSLFFSLLLVLLYVDGSRSHRPLRPLVLGSVAGLAVLSRTDNIVLVIVMYGALLYSRRGPAIRPICVATAVAVMLCVPWFAWSCAQFGTPLQVSASAAPYVTHANYAIAHPHAGLWQSAAHGLELLRHASVEVIPRYYFGSPRLGAIAIVCAAIASAAAGAMRSTVSRSMAPLAPVAAAVCALVVAHAALRWHLREWYFPLVMPLGALAAATVASAIADATARLARWRRGATWTAATVGAAAAISMFVVAGRGFFDAYPRYPQQQVMYEVARDLAATTPPETRVAAFNSGILSFYDQRPTVDLDGVMNADAYAAIRRRDLAAYLRSQRVDLVVDFDAYVHAEFGAYWGQDVDSVLREQRRSPGAGRADFLDYVQYEVLPSR